MAHLCTIPAPRKWRQGFKTSICCKASSRSVQATWTPYMRTKTNMLIQTIVQLSTCIYFNHSDLKWKHFQPLLFLNCVLITLGYVHMCACDFWFLRWPEEHDWSGAGVTGCESKGGTRSFVFPRAASALTVWAICLAFLSVLCMVHVVKKKVAKH